jgi:hypothetical protein
MVGMPWVAVPLSEPKKWWVYFNHLSVACAVSDPEEESCRALKYMSPERARDSANKIQQWLMTEDIMPIFAYYAYAYDAMQLDHPNLTDDFPTVSHFWLDSVIDLSLKHIHRKWCINEDGSPKTF